MSASPYPGVLPTNVLWRRLMSLRSPTISVSHPSDGAIPFTVPIPENTLCSTVTRAVWTFVPT